MCISSYCKLSKTKIKVVMASPAASKGCVRAPALVIMELFKIRSCPQVIDLILYLFGFIIIGGIIITSEPDSSQLFCWNKDCPDYAIKNQGNIVFKERYGKNNHALLKCKTCNGCFSEKKRHSIFRTQYS